MKDVMTLIGGVVLSVAALLGVIYGGIYLYRDAAPRQQAAEREIYEQTPSYVQGKLQLLSKYKREYDAERDPKVRAGIRELALHEAATVDRNRLPPWARQWINQLEVSP